jgi:hypothetical protein
MRCKSGIFRWSAAAALGATLLSAQSEPDALAGFGIGAALRRAEFNPASLADVFGAYRGAFLQYLDARLGFSARMYRMLLRELENGRVDEQAGAANAGIEKAGITGLVTAAVESGTLTQTLDQSLLTLRGNAEGLYRFAAGRPVLPLCYSAAETGCDPSPFNNVELSASFSGAAGAGPHRLTAASVRYVLVNSRDLRSQAYRKAWSDWYAKTLAAVKSGGGDLLAALDAVFQNVAESVYDEWYDGARKALAAAPRDEAAIRAVLSEQLEQLEAAMRRLDPDLDSRAGAALDAYARYFNITRQGFEPGNLPMLTLEGTYQQPAAEPRHFDATAIFAWSPKGKGTVNPGTLTVNAGASLYTKAPAIWRGTQTAVQFERPINGSAALALGGYFQYLMNPALIDPRLVVAGRGSIAVANATVTLRFPNSGVKVPVGVSWSNRTELVTGSEIRGHIGLSFDSHALMIGGKQ